MRLSLTGILVLELMLIAGCTSGGTSSERSGANEHPQIGRVLDALDASDYADNTIIVFWTDHGWNLGEKEHWRKFALWEDSTRTPVIIAGPGVAAAGTRSTRPVSLLDIYPTLLDLCGISPPEELEGASLRPLLADPDAEWAHAAVTTHGRNNHAVRTDRWRYIRYSDGAEELYDHSDDPHEWYNLADEPEHAQTKERLVSRLPAVNVPQASDGQQ